MLKNLMIYRVTDPEHVDLLHDCEALGEKLETVLAHEPTGSQWRCLGFDLPAPTINDHLVWGGAGGVTLFSLYVHERQLPGATIREHIAAKVRAIEEREQRKCYRKEIAQIRDEVEAELLPRAFIKHRVVNMVALDNLLLIDSSNAKLAEDALDTLRRAMGSLAVRPLTFKLSFDTWLTDLARLDEMDNIKRGYAARLMDSEKSQVSFKDIDLGSDEPQEYLENGFNVVEMSASLFDDGDELMRFKMTNQLIFKGLKFSDVAIEGSQRDSDGDPAAILDANLLLVTSAVRSLVEALTDQLGAEAVDIRGSIANAVEGLLAPIDKHGGSLSINGQEVYRSPELSKADQRQLIDTEPHGLEDLLPTETNLNVFGYAAEPADADDEEDEFEQARSAMDEDDEL
ncbi:recombination-associated protein RdgC [Pseudomonas citronellolis]|uniref:recombination-associated protein RdgC n=1 Tax=Pseudomonas citronellolis TaxID=53408 RepID=UPI00248D59E8|nr:recombination-associated protein RdgC [Pseudomonas citronellolis]